MKGYKATAIIIAHNEAEFVPDCLEALSQTEGIENAIIIDNGSGDGLAEWLQEQSNAYIIFDEGRQCYGKVLNTVLEQFEPEEFLFVLSPRYLTGKETAVKMMKALENHPDSGMISEDIFRMGRESNKEESFCVLGFWQELWAAKRDFLRDKKFNEELLQPWEALLDYQLNLIKDDYHVLLCPGVSIQDMKKESVGLKPSKELKQRWNMNYFNVEANHNIINLIDKEKEDNLLVLEIGCDLGATLLEITNKFPNCRVYGLEINEQAAAIAQHVAKVETGNIEEYNLPFEEDFDIIILADVLEHLHNPQGAIAYLRERLKPEGAILASIPNIMHISVMQQLVNGVFQYEDAGLLDRTHIHFFTYYQLAQMFSEEKYQIDEICRTVVPATKEQEELMQTLLALSQNTESFMYDTFQYLIRAKKE